MAYKADKTLVYTKNSYERFLNTLDNRESIHLSIKKDSGYIDGIGGYSNEKFGSNLRKKDKLEFSRLYLMWLNTK